MGGKTRKGGKRAVITQTKEQKTIKKIVKKTVENMTALGTYRAQFAAAIQNYAEMRYQLSELNAQFYAGGCKITEMYTNKAGATNERKTALYMAIETLRRDIAATEDRLGLTPSGMKRINDREMKSRKRESKLDRALKSSGK